jgi:hypothetical protein
MKITIMETKAEKLANSLQNTLDYTEKLWKDGEFSHAYIVGYLQGLVKIAIEELKSFENTSNKH